MNDRMEILEMGIFNTLKNKLIQSAVHTGKVKARRQLLSMPDRQLTDFGVSRELLVEGVSAWPWRIESQRHYAGEGLTIMPAITQVAEPARNKSEIRQAVKELNSYSDRELAELGITRNSIKDAVQYGRPSVEGVFQNNRNVA